MITRLLPLFLVAATLPAAELVVRDIGAGLVLPATGFDFTVSDDTGSRSGNDSFQHAFGAVIGGRWSFAPIGDPSGAVLGADLLVERAAYPAGGTWSATQVRGAAGWGWAVSDRLTLIGEGLLGLGYARLALDGNGETSDFTANGALLAPGVQGVAAWSFTDRWVGWASLGYSYQKARLTGDGADVDLTISGFAVGIGLSWRITDRPFLLE